MTIQDRINEASTIDNAKKYEAESESFMFCQELLGDISASHPMIDEWINELEDRFDELNGVAV